MKQINRFICIVAILGILGTACTDDLNTTPPNTETPETVYSTYNGHVRAMAKIYAGLSTTGNEGPAGQPDITSLDEGSTDYVRMLWVAQELPTDELTIRWGDPDLPEMQNFNWTPENVWVNGLYARLMFQVNLVNEFLKNTKPDVVAGKGFTQNEVDDIAFFRSEARFIRALMYWNGLDVYGRMPMVTEDDPIGTLFFPEQAKSKELFDFIESEIMAIEGDLPNPGANDYGRVNKAIAWMLLAKLYLNAEVYVGENKYNDAITNLNKVIGSGVYSLDSQYSNIFRGDNHTSPEIIFPIVYDGVNLRTYGGTTYMVHGSIGGTMADNPEDYGTTQGWWGFRALPALATQFEYNNDDPMDDSPDSRAMFWKDGHSLNITAITGDFTEGFGVTKWNNLGKNGNLVTDVLLPNNARAVDIDFPMFRLADAYLMYAEATLRGGNGAIATALDYVNELRERAYGDDSGNIGIGDLTLDFILDERSRELYWEGHRRTDLNRYGLFTDGSYVWAWKGNDVNGVGVSDHLSVYPIPDSEDLINPNIEQNPGY